MRRSRAVGLAAAIVGIVAVGYVSGQGPATKGAPAQTVNVQPITPITTTGIVGVGQRFQLAQFRQNDSPNAKLYIYILDTQTGECWEREVGSAANSAFKINSASSR